VSYIFIGIIIYFLFYFLLFINFLLLLFYVIIYFDFLKLLFTEEFFAFRNDVETPILIQLKTIKE